MHSQPTQADELQKTVMHANRLCPALRRVFLLCDIRGFAIAETAAILDISSTAVTIRLDRARREMNARLNSGETRRCVPSDENSSGTEPLGVEGQPGRRIRKLAPERFMRGIQRPKSLSRGD